MRPPDTKPVRITRPEERRARYGDPFFPKVPFQSIFYITAIFGALVFLALASPAPLQDPADPLNHAAIDPRPEWYFMFLFQLLKYFSGPFVVVATVIIPTILVLLLLGLPFYDRNWSRKITARPLALIAMSASMMMVIFLTWGGLGFPNPNWGTTSGVAVSPSKSATVVAAAPVSFKADIQTIFQAHCAVCHIDSNLGGLSLASYQSLLKGGTFVTGPVVKPGDYVNSILWQVVTPAGSPPIPRMPFGGPYLDDAQINTIAAWIQQGAKNN